MEVKSTATSTCFERWEIMNSIKKYIELMKLYVDGDITSLEFEKKYLEMYKNATEIFPENYYNILNLIFSDVDAFCNDPELSDDDDIDEKELTKRIESALNEMLILQMDQ